jgi:hypothetical protein
MIVLCGLDRLAGCGRSPATTHCASPSWPSPCGTRSPGPRSHPDRAGAVPPPSGVVGHERMLGTQLVWSEAWEPPVGIEPTTCRLQGPRCPVRGCAVRSRRRDGTVRLAGMDGGVPERTRPGLRPRRLVAASLRASWSDCPIQLVQAPNAVAGARRDPKWWWLPAGGLVAPFWQQLFHSSRVRERPATEQARCSQWSGFHIPHHARPSSYRVTRWLPSGSNPTLATALGPGRANPIWRRAAMSQRRAVP